MNDLIFLLRDVFVFTFENLMEPLGNIPNYTFVILGFIGLFVWLKMQSKFNADAANNPDQIK